MTFVYFYNASFTLLMILISSSISESEQSLASKNDELQMQLKELQIESVAMQREKETLAEQLRSVDADYTSYCTHMEATLKDLQRENESLKVKYSVKEGELEVSLCVLVAQDFMP